MAPMSRKEAIKYLGICERMMCELTAKRKVAYIQHKPGGKMSFLKEDLDAYIESIRVPTLDELARRGSSLPGGSTYRRRRGG